MVSRRYFKVKQPNVIHETIDNEAIIVNLENGNYYSLENIGADIWDLIKLGTALDEVVETIASRYEGDYTTIGNEIDHFLSELQAEELIAPIDSNEATIKPEAKPNIDSEGTTERSPFTAPVLAKYTDMQDLLLLDPIHEVDEQGWPHIKANSDKVPE